MQLLHRFALPRVSLTVFLLFACIPPPVSGEPAAPKLPAPADTAHCILDSLSLFTITLPLPQQGIAATSILDSIATQARELSAEEQSVSPQSADNSQEQTPPSASDLVETARTFSGVRYRWAGMSSRGMDCSGFIARVLRVHGIRAPHNAAQLFVLGWPVSYEELKPGDLLFFQTSRRGISHVGMYIGNDEFIHASSGAGRVVTTSLHDPYYASRLKGGRRLGY